jgi:hypothetical protein
MLPARAPITVLVFFSPRCHCLAAHEPRLLALHARYQGRGVQFFMVDSEKDAGSAGDEAEARRRGYPFPILLDRGGTIAERLGAEYAAYSVVLDAAGAVRYHGGIDSDRITLHEDATPYLKWAVDDLLASRTPRLAEGKALGCALERW